MVYVYEMALERFTVPVKQNFTYIIWNQSYSNSNSDSANQNYQ